MLTLNDALMDIANGTHRAVWALSRRRNRWRLYLHQRRSTGQFQAASHWLLGNQRRLCHATSSNQFKALSAYLKAQTTAKIPGTQIDYYGTVIVR